MAIFISINNISKIAAYSYRNVFHLKKINVTNIEFAHVKANLNI